MKKAVFITFMICMILFVPGVKTAQAKPTLDSVIKQISVELTLSREVYNASQPVKILYTITNRSDTPVYILRWATPLEGFAADLFTVTLDGKKPIPYIGPLVSRIGPRPEDYVKLGANGGSVSNALDLAEGYALASAGEYSLTYRTRILDVTLEKPTSKQDHFFTAGIQKIISKKFQLSDKRRSAFEEPQLTAPAAPRGRDPLTSPGEFSYLQEPIFADAKADDDAYRTVCDCRSPGPVCKFDPQGSCIPDPHPEITDANQIDALKKIYREALKKAAEAKVVLNGTPYEEIARGAERYRAYFGAADRSRRDNILSTYGVIYNFGFISDVNQAVTFYLGPMCRPYWAAYVTGADITTGKKRIYICPDFWTKIPYLPVDSSDSQVGAVLHEMSHLAGGSAPTSSSGLVESAIGDLQYSDLECIKLARNKPDEAVKNADNYHLFAMNRHDLNMGLDRPHARLRTGQGTLLAQNGGGSILDACGKPDAAAAGFSLYSLRENKLLFDSTGEPLLIASWTPFVPADGDRVKLVTTDRKHVVFAPTIYATGALTIRADVSDSGYYTIRQPPGWRVGSETQIALQAPNDSYLAATGSCGDGSIVAIPSTGIIPEMIFAAPWGTGVSKAYVHLRTADGHYLSARRFSRLRGTEVLVATSETDSTRCPHCTFLLSFVSGKFPPFMNVYPLHLMTYDGAHFLAHRSGSGAALSAVESIVPPFEGLTIDQDPRKIRTGDVITLRTTSGRSFQEWRFIAEIAR